VSVPHAIETLSTRIVQEAPAIDPKVLQALHSELDYVGSPLALVIWRIYELVDEGLVDKAVALPALAEACAARYQIDTLTPMPDKPPKLGTPDVPLTSLKRRP